MLTIANNSIAGNFIIQPSIFLQVAQAKYTEIERPERRLPILPSMEPYKEYYFRIRYCDINGTSFDPVSLASLYNELISRPIPANCNLTPEQLGKIVDAVVLTIYTAQVQANTAQQ